MTISVAFIHAHQNPARVKSFARLCEALGIDPKNEVRDDAFLYRTFGGTEPRAAWSLAAWKWSFETGAEHCLFLQDDVIAAPELFWSVLRLMIAARPSEIISLYSAHQAARKLVREWGPAGPHSASPQGSPPGRGFYSVSDCVGGPAYVLPRAVLGEFLVWRASQLHPGAADYLGEDDTIALFCMATGRKIFYPVCSVADHDNMLDSTFGFVTHQFRRSACTWQDLEALGISTDALLDPELWKSSIHLGKQYGEAITYQARDWVKGWTQEQTAAALAEKPPEEYDLNRWILKP